MAESFSKPSMESFYPSLNKAYARIDERLGEALNLSVLAEVAGYSPFHFHRLFHAATGRTLHEYVLERRVAAAASRLLYGRESVTRVAMDLGFSSSAAFARAFRKALGRSPTAYRRDAARMRPPDRSSERFRAFAEDPVLEAAFTPQVLPDLRVAGIVCEGLSTEFESKAIEAAFARLWAWMNGKGLPVSDLWGLTLDTPEITPLDRCRYFACAPVGPDVAPEGEIAVRDFPTGGLCLRFALYPDDRPFAERYHKVGDALEIDFHVPVRTL
ncbi:MAG TPA: AraC family transcriptional regulator [Clostridia bacterium]|nr:AraC family transcriptional regulator [Clostridia bacterium]